VKTKGEETGKETGPNLGQRVSGSSYAQITVSEDEGYESAGALTMTSWEAEKIITHV
jgi:hypothetical protein